MAITHIENGILDGTYRPGVQLPTERDLAVDLGVGRGSVREAIRALRAEGIITSSTGPGRGTRVSTGQAAAVGRVLRLHLALGASTITDITETRVALERSTSRLAAIHAGDAETRRLDEWCERMAAAAEVSAFNAADTQFHMELARASGNQLAADLTVAICEAVRERILDAERRRQDWPAVKERLVGEHREIARAVREHRPEDAASLMESHIRESYSLLLAP